MTVLARAKVVERKRSKRGLRYMLNEKFPYLIGLQNLLLNAPARGEEMYEHIRRTGTIKLIVLAGVFVGDWEGSIDLLVVGDRVKERRLKDRIHLLEAEIGKELRYAYLTTSDFFYRLNISDRLVRDVFDFPHKVTLDRLDIGLK